MPFVFRCLLSALAICDVQVVGGARLMEGAEDVMSTEGEMTTDTEPAEDATIKVEKATAQAQFEDIMWLGISSNAENDHWKQQLGTFDKKKNIVDVDLDSKIRNADKRPTTYGNDDVPIEAGNNAILKGMNVAYIGSPGPEVNQEYQGTIALLLAKFAIAGMNVYIGKGAKAGDALTVVVKAKLEELKQKEDLFSPFALSLIRQLDLKEDTKDIQFHAIIVCPGSAGGSGAEAFLFKEAALKAIYLRSGSKQDADGAKVLKYPSWMSKFDKKPNAYPADFRVVEKDVEGFFNAVVKNYPTSETETLEQSNGASSGSVLEENAATFSQSSRYTMDAFVQKLHESLKWTSQDTLFWGLVIAGITVGIPLLCGCCVCIFLYCWIAEKAAEVGDIIVKDAHKHDKPRAGGEAGGAPEGGQSASEANGSVPTFTAS